MKKLKNLIIYFFIITLFNSCSSIREGFSLQKKDNTDEFLVEKKNPLKLPPDFDELPMPSEDLINENQKENELKKMILKSEGNTDRTSNEDLKVGKSLSEILLDKIREN